MKILWTSFFVLLSFWSIGQERDTALVRVEVDSLIELSKSLLAEGKFNKALQISESAIASCLTAFDKNSALYGRVLLWEGSAYHRLGDFTKAETLYLESKNILEQTIGKNHPDYLSTLINLAYMCIRRRDFKQSEAFFFEAQEIEGKKFGKDSPEYAMVLKSSAKLYFVTRDYEKSEAIFSESKEIFGKTLGKEHFEYGNTLGYLAMINQEMGSYEKAEQMYLESLSLKEKKGKINPEFAVDLHNLAMLYNQMGEFKKSEKTYLEALDIREKTIGKKHFKYALTLSNLGSLYYDIGSYEKAEEVFLEALDIREKTLGTENAEYASSINNLANVYYSMGNFEKAEKMFSESIDIKTKVLGEKHPEIINAINNLGNVYFDIEDYQKAEKLYLHAKDIREETVGKKHPDYAYSIGRLARTYEKSGENKKVESMYLEAIVIHEESSVKNHIGYSYTLSNLAEFYARKGEYEKAEKLFLQAKGIQEKIVGKFHINYAMELINLINLCQITDNYEKAEPLVFEWIEIEKLLLLNGTRFLSEKELLIYSNHFVQSQSRFNSFTQRQLQFSGLAYDNHLFYKGFLLSAVQKIKKSAQTNGENLERYNEIKAYYRRLATEYSKPLADRQNVAELEEKANTLEKELARTVAGYGDALRQISWQEVQNELTTNEAAIEFIHYQYHNPNPTDSILYAALVLRPDMKQPQFIPLFEEKQLKNLHHQSENPTKLVNDFYAWKSENKSLNQLIYQPLKEALADVKTIYFAPSGQLHRLNLAAIPLDEKTTLGDRFQLIRVGSTRQLVINETLEKETNQEAVLFGAIQYEAASLPKAVAQNTLSTSVEMTEETEESTTTTLQKRGLSNDFSFTAINSTLRGGDWKYLKWTEVEIDGIELILEDANMEIAVKKGMDASEEAFKTIGENAASPKILHLATHGFFFPDPEKVVHSRRLMTDGDNEPVFKVSDHPMIRSGLVLAGGNHAWKTGKPIKEGMEDGILTAYEISQMNLSNTELVVLSACETGLGDIEGNEGVYGLQRAFKIAGAKYLIMSLWQVPDFQTQELMTAFYVNWLEEGMEIPQAFRAAQKELKKRYPAPFSWAGFVLVE